MPVHLLVPLLLSLLSAGCAECSSSPGTQSGTQFPDSRVLPYRLNHPDAAFALPNSLKEISGLTISSDSSLAAIQDEKGNIYFLDQNTARIIHQYKFRGRGDYEGIEFVNGVFWILRSNGKLYSVSSVEGEEEASEEHDTDLHRNCDAEGLAYQAAMNRLLIACKEHPGRGLGRSRAIYSFDLATNRRLENPVYLIAREGLETSRKAFKPSAIAIHPKSGYLYVLSSVHKLLVLIDMTGAGEMIEVHVLSEDLFPQPEGLAFTSDGTLFISNEGVRGPATLLRFDEQGATQ